MLSVNLSLLIGCFQVSCLDWRCSTTITTLEVWPTLSVFLCLIATPAGWSWCWYTLHHLGELLVSKQELMIRNIALPVVSKDGHYLMKTAVHHLCCRTSFVGHLAGILVGLLYTMGPLEAIMKKCAGLKISQPQSFVPYGWRFPQNILSDRPYVNSAHLSASIVIPHANRGSAVLSIYCLQVLSPQMDTTLAIMLTTAHLARQVTR